MESKGFTNTTLSEKMGVTKQAVGQMIKAESLTTATLEKLAAALGVPMWHLIVSPEEVAVDVEESKNDFAAFVRCKGIHFTADSFEEFQKIVEQINEVAK